MARWLRICLPMQGVRVRSLVGELRFHRPHGQKNQNIKQEQYYNKNSIKLKMVTSKKTTKQNKISVKKMSRNAYNVKAGFLDKSCV